MYRNKDVNFYRRYNGDFHNHSDCIDCNQRLAGYSTYFVSYIYSESKSQLFVYFGQV